MDGVIVVELSKRAPYDAKTTVATNDGRFSSRSTFVVRLTQTSPWGQIKKKTNVPLRQITENFAQFKATLSFRFVRHRKGDLSHCRRFGRVDD